VAQYLLSKDTDKTYKINPNRFSAVGCGESRLLVSDDSSINRNQNPMTGINFGNGG